MEKGPPTDEEILAAAEVLQTMALSPRNCDAMRALYKSAKHFLNMQNRVLNKCGIRLLRDERAAKQGGLIGGFLPPAVLAPPIATLNANPTKTTVLGITQNCYICKAQFTELHHFYDKLCGRCGDKNYAKRQQSANLSGKCAIVTGGRIKIGYETALKLLRAGARVIVTTRFVHDACLRYKSEVDYTSFSARLTIYELDMLNAMQLNSFVKFARSQQPIDILINNAAQTIARPPEFFRTLQLDQQATRNTTSITPRTTTTTNTTTTTTDTQCARANDPFPLGVVDEHGSQVDHRRHNTWTMPFEEIPLQELLDATMINYFSPFIIMQKLFQAYASPAYVINVTAMEGKFSCYKTGYHAHTNGAKASLNMLTRTVGELWAKQKIYVACVDTGWITNEYPISAEYDLESKFHPPLDEIDGAARVLDPVFCDLKCRGVFYKDYGITSW